MISLEELVEVDMLNIGGILLWVSNMIWFPETAYELITWMIGVCVGLSLISLNIMKIGHMIKKDNENIDRNAGN